MADTGPRARDGGHQDDRSRYKYDASSSSDLLSFMQNLPGLIYRCVNDKRWTMLAFGNGQCELLTGYRDEQLLGNGEISYADLILAEDADRVDEEVQRALGLRRSFEVEYRIATASGEVKWVRECGQGVWDASGELAYIEGFIRDITERKQLERQLLQAQKMETIGHLASGIAHDFNNLLTVINSYSDMILSDLPPEHPIAQDLMEVHHAGQRATALTRQLLTFSRKEPRHIMAVDLNEVVARMEKMLRRLIHENIQFSTELAEDVGHVYADPHQLEQIIVNLVVNARDAMPEGGWLHVSTAERAVLHDERAGVADGAPGEYVMLRVADTGQGITAQHLDHIFEPFYTTKTPEKGTGLGLSTVHGIVKQCKGHVKVHSEPGAGATFEIYLPRTRTAEPEQCVMGAKDATVSGDEIVLLVEDEADVRRLIQRMLEKYGYRVLAFERCEEALDCCRTDRPPIGVLVSDVVMPGMSGVELARTLAPLYCDLRVVLVSGYAPDTVLGPDAVGRNIDFLPKPFSVDELLGAIRKQLDASTSEAHALGGGPNSR